jgi:hypothetical protein
MKHILIGTAIAAMALLSFGCADTSVPAGRISTSRSGSSTTGGIDPITQAGIDDTARQTQEDAQRMSDWINQQNNLEMMNQANQAANQAAMDASNAAAAAAAAANQ